VHDELIIEAVIEVARQQIHLAAPLAVQTLRHEMANGKSSDRIKSALAILEKFMPTKQLLEVKVEKVDHTADAIAHLKHLRELGVGHETLVKEFGELGLSHYS
jgi:hypothetical protein